MSAPGPAHRRRKRIWREWPLILVLAVVGSGLWVVADDHFKRGTVLFALGVCLAAVLRAALPNGSAGLLRVRSRFVDVLTLAALGGATLVAALIVPPPT
ncbi:MAG: DUF3017 domain-containing protein [Jiangellaceae bacterium]